MLSKFSFKIFASCAHLLLLANPNVAWGQGAILQAAGPVNRSMGGAAVAAPLDAIGAIYWNPATISGLSHSETAFALDLLFANHTVSSTLGPFSGSTEAETGAFPIPNFGLVEKTQNDSITVGLGVNSVAGFGTNLPSDSSNPILAPPPLGLGQVNSNALFLQLSPVVSIAATENLSVGFGPTITAGRLTLEPFVLNAANADGSYPTGQGTRYHWGGGFQAGTYYIYDEQWRLGASFKSPTWMETFQFNGLNELGLPRRLSLDLDLPMIVSVGASYQANAKTLVALDIRYFDYAHTDGLGDRAIFDASGALGGLDFSSIFAAALGAQRVITESLTVRGGYTYNQNPIKNSEAFFNIASPVICEHMFSTGATYNFTEHFSASVAYSYYLENKRTGQIVLPGIGAVPGSIFVNEVDVHLFDFGLAVRH